MSDLDTTRPNGNIGAESGPGKGAAFAASPPDVESPRRIPPRSARVLVMDDEAAIRLMAERMLERCGYSVATAPDAAQTIARYRQALEEGHPFDVVIMDLIIPGGPGGMQAIQDLLAIDPHARVIASSGYSEFPVMADPCAFGFKAAVPKPYFMRALCDAVARVLA